MRAVITLSEEGALLGERVCSAFPGWKLYGKHLPPDAEGTSFDSLKELTEKLFPRAEVLLFIMASGIVVRMIAPLVKNKLYDPAVLVMDECGKHVISLLSGHIGGANACARAVAESLNAEPVITTATDVHGYVAPDAAAYELGFTVENPEKLKVINRLVADGENIPWYISPELLGYHGLEHYLRGNGIEFEPLDDFSKDSHLSGAVIVTGRDKIFLQEKSCPVLILHPARICIGIGCRKGVPSEEILTAIRDFLKKNDISEKNVSSFASITLKKEEQGLLEAVESLGKTIRFYEPSTLSETIIKYHLEESPFVKKVTGTGNVADAAALSGKGHRKLICGKTKYSRITLAAAMEL